MASPYSRYSTRRTPQSRRIPGSNQVENSAGGFVWEISKWERLNRFLILGSEGGTYYIDERKLTTQNADVVMECIQEDGIRTVQTIVSVSQEGRAPKNDPALFALAMASGASDVETRRAALEALPKVARTGTHLFQFVNFMLQFRGWGRANRRAVAKWFTDKDPDQLAYQMVKYRMREGWTHHDLHHLSHPKPTNEVMANLLRWAKDSKHDVAYNHENLPQIVKAFQDLPQIVKAFQEAQASTSPERTKTILINNPGLPREALKTEHLVSPMVQMQLLENGMPMTALVRNLGNLSKSGVLTPMSEAMKIVTTQLTNEEHIKKSRIHPIQVLLALATYRTGHSYRGSGSWNVVAPVVDALDEAFYLAFANVESTGKNTMLALDVSSSMSHAMAGPISCAMGAAAMAMVTARTETNHMFVAFHEGLTLMDISPRQRLDDVMRTTAFHNFGGTDCAMPMIAASQQGWDIDTFIVYTDNETWAGIEHPAQALKEYRNHNQKPNAKLVVVGMASNGFSIADPNDPGMLDVVGFDASVPPVIADFSR